MTGAQIVVETLIEQDTEVVFGYPGGAVLNLYDELYKSRDRIKHVLSAHEQGAAHAGDGYARATGKVGVVFATSGPGATNLVTGIANAYLDSVPVVFITGNVPCSLIGRDSFQEVDITGVTLPVVKHSYFVKDVTKLADTIREAFQIAKSGRPGPVLIDIPKDVQIADCDFENKEILPELASKKGYNEEQLNKALEMINAAKKPYIFVGGGVLVSEAEKEVAELAEKLDAPIGTSMMGLSAVPASSHRKLGMVGMHGIYSSTVVKNRADLVIALGCRFSDRATGNRAAYLKNSKIIHIDIDAAEINKNINCHLGVVGDVKEILTKLLPNIAKVERPEWWQEIESVKRYERENSAKQEGFSPFKIIEAVNKYTQADTPVATDVGQHQMWVAQHYNFEAPKTLVTSGGLGTMGFGMGAAIGACVATGKRTVLFTGDGSFGMNLNEMATAVSQKLPLVVVLMNNGVLGMVRQWQTMFYQKHYSETTLQRQTDFVKLTEAFGGKGYRATNLEELDAALNEAFNTEGPVLIDCVIDCDERVLPMIPAGGTVEDLVIN